MKRHPKWRQETPRQQIVALVQAAQGDISNVVDGGVGASRVNYVLNRAVAFLEDVQKIVSDMPEGKWDDK